jgi:aspartate aminotransferase
MKPFREEIEALQQSPITRFSLPHMQDKDVIPLWYGEGDTVTPDFICRAATKALEAGQTFYTHTRGGLPLRAALKTYLDGLYNLDIDPERITVPGAAMLGINIAAQTALTSGDHGLIIGPAWPNIETCFRVTGASVGYVYQNETDKGWQISVEDIINAVLPNTKAIFVNSPCNPTGWVMQRSEQEELLEFCRARQILIIADEVYHRIVYDQNAAPSFLSVARDDDPVIVVNSFSKAWAMTGWRIGWVVTPKRHVSQWAGLSESFNTGATNFIQAGAIAALEQGEDFVKQQVKQFSQSRSRVIEAFSRCPTVSLCAPEGAFYAFPRITDTTSCEGLVEEILQKTKVGLAPGNAFGPSSDAYFRLCFARSPDNLQIALDRMVSFFQTRKA